MSAALKIDHLGCLDGSALARQVRHDIPRNFGNRSQVVSSMSRSQNATEDQVISNPATGRTSREQSTVQSLTIDDCKQMVRDALTSAYGGTDAVIKRIQRVANCNESTAKAWMNGTSAPSMLHFLRLLAEVPELQAEVRRLTRMESDLDPRFERSMNEAMQFFMRMRKP